MPDRRKQACGERLQSLPLLFRQATPNDAPAILALYRSVIGSSFCTWDEAYPAAGEIAFDLAHGGLYVLSAGSRLVGTISLVAENELDEHPGWSPLSGPCRELARVAIAPAFQGQGLSARLVREAEALLRDSGCRGLHLAVACINLPARRCYARCGFRAVGEAELYGNRYILMEKTMTPKEDTP